MRVIDNTVVSPTLLIGIAGDGLNELLGLGIDICFVSTVTQALDFVLENVTVFVIKLELVACPDAEDAEGDGDEYKNIGDKVGNRLGLRFSALDKASHGEHGCNCYGLYAAEDIVDGGVDGGVLALAALAGKDLINVRDERDAIIAGVENAGKPNVQNDLNNDPCSRCGGGANFIVNLYKSKYDQERCYCFDSGIAIGLGGANFVVNPHEEDNKGYSKSEIDALG